MQTTAEVAAVCGVSMREIARTLGVSKETIRLHLVPDGLERRRERARRYNDANRDKERERGRRYREANPERIAWSHMLQRCNNPARPDFHHYGGRGITVCPRWRESFEAFLADMGPRPSPQHSIDRIDNEGPYSPENCRWATREEQNRNTRQNRMVELPGLGLMTLAEAADLCGVPYSTARKRLNRGAAIHPELEDS